MNKFICAGVEIESDFLLSGLNQSESAVSCLQSAISPPTLKLRRINSLKRYQIADSGLLTAEYDSKMLFLSKTSKTLNLENTLPYFSWQETDGSSRLNFYRLNKKIVLSYPDLCEFVIEQNKITYYCYQKISENLLSHLFLDQIFPLYLSQNKKVLHSSAISINNQAILFSAASGNGKSTFVNNCLEYGALISDDFTPIIFNKGKLFAERTYPAIRLIENNTLPKKQKVIERFTAQQLTEIKTIILLERSKHEIQTEILPADNTYVFEFLLKQFLSLFPDSREEQKNIFEFLVNLLKSLKVYQLRFYDLKKEDYLKLLIDLKFL